MNPEKNKSLVMRTFDEIINQERREAIDEVYAEELIVHDPFLGTMQGVQVMRDLLAVFDTGFPHHRVQVHSMTAEGDLVAVLHTHTAVHNGAFNGIPATGRSVVVPGVELFRVADGKIVEFWRHDNDLGLLMQIGAVPAPAHA